MAMQQALTEIKTLHKASVVARDIKCEYRVTKRYERIMKECVKETVQ